MLKWAAMRLTQRRLYGKNRVAAGVSWADALDEWDTELEGAYAQDFADCMSGRRKVIINEEYNYEMYKSSNGNVYVYWTETTARRIYKG